MKRKLQLEQQLYLDYTRAALRILQRSLELARGTEPDFYRVAAVELRLLLCDSTRQHGRVVDVSLIPRLWRGLTLPPLGVEGGFKTDQTGLLLPDWLEQPIPEMGLTLRQLIRRVCDQDGGAHVDLRETENLGDTQSGREWILKIGDVILSELSRIASSGQRLSF